MSGFSPPQAGRNPTYETCQKKCGSGFRVTRHALPDLLSGFSFVRRLPDSIRNPTYCSNLKSSPNKFGDATRIRSAEGLRLTPYLFPKGSDFLPGPVVANVSNPYRGQLVILINLCHYRFRKVVVSQHCAVSESEQQ